MFYKRSVQIFHNIAEKIIIFSPRFVQTSEAFVLKNFVFAELEITFCRMNRDSRCALTTNNTLEIAIFISFPWVNK